MKSTGMVRQVDELGRIVLPVELRRTLDIGIRDGLDILVDNDRIVLRKYEPGCVFCGQIEDVTSFKGKKVCSHCVEQLPK